MKDESVDLGLSSKYATCNLGASSPEESGEYYAWGETDSRTIYNKENYRWFTERTETKYGRDGDCSRLDPMIKTTLDPEDDVAHIRLGGSWRIPNLRDIAELHEKCSWRWTRRNGMKGYLITSEVEGYTDRSIFLPAVGFISQTNIVNYGHSGYYWTSELYNQNAKHAIATVFDRTILIKYLPNQRYAGLTIRPVCD